MQGGTVLEAEVHRFDDRWSPTKAHLIIDRYRRYARRYGVTAIMVKVPPARMHSAAVRSLMERTERLARQLYCDFDFITKSEIRSTLGFDTVAEIASYVQRTYPELTITYKEGALNEKASYRKLHEAVLAAEIFQKRLRERATHIPKTT